MIEEPQPVADAVLAVDLDGTLLDGDMLRISALELSLKRPWSALMFPLWLGAGRAVLKHRIAERVELDVSRLDYRADVLEFIRQRRELGQIVVLATASTTRYAEQVAVHLGLFDEVMASTETFNLKAGNKARALKERYAKGFEYVGDSRADLPVWREAIVAHLVDPDPALERLAAAATTVGRIFR